MVSPVTSTNQLVYQHCWHAHHAPQALGHSGLRLSMLIGAREARDPQQADGTGAVAVE